MKRIQLFEFEDFAWFPKGIRSSMTNLIIVLMKWMGTTEVIKILVKDLIEKGNHKQVTDLGSGSGGVMPDVVRELNVTDNSAIKLQLTDLHPNPNIADVYNRVDDEVSYRTESVNAVNLANAPEGLVTMVNSFHHMPPTVAKAILKSAQENKRTLLIYELAQNKIPFLIWCIMLPISLVILMLMTWVMTPMVKGLTFQQVVFTYFIPIIPICYAWDGQASMPRTYAFKDLEEMIHEFRSEDYQWIIEPTLKPDGKKAGYCVKGIPAS